MQIHKNKPRSYSNYLYSLINMVSTMCNELKIFYVDLSIIKLKLKIFTQYLAYLMP